MVLSVALITQVVAILSSIAAEFVQKWDGWAYKRQTLLVFTFLVPLAIWALVCLTALPLPVTGVECDTAGYIAVIGLVLRPCCPTREPGIYSPGTRSRRREGKKKRGAQTMRPVLLRW